MDPMQAEPEIVIVLQAVYQESVPRIGDVRKAEWDRGRKAKQGCSLRWRPAQSAAVLWSTNCSKMVSTLR